MKTIALDIATTTGYCTEDMSGSFNLRKGITKNKYSELYNFLTELHWHYGFDTIAVERVAGRFKNALIQMSKLHGIVQLFAHNNNCNVIEYSPTEIKKNFTGKGNASKEMMIDRFREITGRDPIDDNEADAFAILNLHNTTK